jgi:NAD-dependent SIR2 family protein deacetylase
MYCGCFHCLNVFEATEVVDWIDDGETPLCPRCGVDAVMLGVTDIMELLAMQRIRFPRGRVDRKAGTATDSSTDL